MPDGRRGRDHAGRTRSFVASVAGDAANQEELLPYRLRTVRIGIQATAMAALALVAYLFLPGHGPIHIPVYLTVLGLCIVGGTIVQFLPWQRLFERGWGILVMFAWSVLDIVLVSAAIWASGPRSPMFLIYGLTTLFFAASYPRRGQLVLTVFTAASYLTVVALSDESLSIAFIFLRLASLGILTFMASFMSTELMLQLRAHLAARDESEGRSQLLATVAEAARGISNLSPEEVLSAVVDSVRDLGFEASAIAAVNEDNQTFRATHTRGLPEAILGQDVPLTAGVVGEVFRTGQTVIVDDYVGSTYALEALRDTGLKVLISTPIRAGNKLTAVLIAASTKHRPISPQDNEAFDLLASLAGRALENAERYQELERFTTELSARTEQRNQAEAAKSRLEEQLAQAQKLEAIGLLAGGVAHDFNNLLSVMQNYTRFVWESLEENDPNRQDLEEVLIAGERGASLVGQLLTFSRKEVVRPTVLDLNDLIDDMRTMLQTTVTEVTTISYDLDRNVPPVEVDQGQAQQVLMNLLVNARDAMTEGGTVIIETSCVDFDEPASPEIEGLAPGRYVCLSVSDNGSGMTSEISARIFEPFFTTKTRGAGTGLGLATVYGIVSRYGGRITVYSEVGLGTTFKVFLPASSQPIRVAEKAVPGNRRGRGEAVLVAEDELAICRIVERVLRANGYRPVVASSPLEAMEQARSRRFDLLLTDVVMPKMSGKQLAETVRIAQPEIKVLFMSGYAEGVVADQGLLDGSDVLLQKPFSAEQLLVATRSMLDAPMATPRS